MFPLRVKITSFEFEFPSWARLHIFFPLSFLSFFFFFFTTYYNALRVPFDSSLSFSLSFFISFFFFYFLPTIYSAKNLNLTVRFLSLSLCPPSISRYVSLHFVPMLCTSICLCILISLAARNASFLA